MASGYENAPISLFISCSSLLCSFFFGSSKELVLDINSLARGEVWRIFSSQFVFSNMAETVVGMMLLYICRQFERQLGIKKFGAFSFLSFLMSTGMQLGVISIAAALGMKYVPSQGPYFLLFSQLPLYYRYVPKLHSTEYSILGISLSEKSWTYLLAGQLCLCKGTRSLGPSVIGILVGYLYMVDKNRLQKFRLPTPVENFCGFVGGFVVSLIPMGHVPPRGDGPGQGGGAAGRGLEMGRLGRGGGAGAGTGAGGDWRNAMQGLGQDARDGLQGYGGFGRMGYGGLDGPPTEENITSLTSLGFERAAVIRALEATGNNVDAAANLLLR